MLRREQQASACCSRRGSPRASLSRLSAGSLQGTPPGSALRSRQRIEHGSASRSAASRIPVGSPTPGAGTGFIPNLFWNEQSDHCDARLFSGDLSLGIGSGGNRRGSFNALLRVGKFETLQRPGLLVSTRLAESEGLAPNRSASGEHPTGSSGLVPLATVSDSWSE